MTALFSCQLTLNASQRRIEGQGNRSQAVDFVMCRRLIYKNSSGDEIANVNFLRQHRTCRGQRLRPFNEFVISTKRLRQKRYTLPTCLEMDSPVQSASHNKWTRPSVKESHQDMGVGNYSLKSTLLPPVVLPKYSLNSRADRN